MRTRRQALIGASCAALAAAVPLAPAFGAANIRRNIVDVENDPGALQALRDAVDLLRKKDDYGRRLALDGWFALATSHNQLCFGSTGIHEIHYSWWFLPWHRAYLIHVERALQDAIGEPSLTIPYWDWLMTPALPEAVSGPAYRKAGATVPNPLFDDERYGPVGQGQPVNVIDLGAPGKTEEEFITIDTFDKFGGGQPLDRQTKRPGHLEGTPHAYIHRAIGYDRINNRIGFMADGMAPLDPIFHLHHANVDRLWIMWMNAGGRRTNPADPAWLEHRFTFPDTKTFKLIDYRIADLLDTETSAGHYRYDRDRVVGPVTNAGTLVLHGIPISPLPATISVFAERPNAAPIPVGSISTIPSQAGGKMDAVLPITGPLQPVLSGPERISIRAVTAGTDTPVIFDGFTIELPR
jgi:hypothetical protein